ncbi:hypothetical protein AK812_SmicGene44683, partial [Symbiodinium microadriaticum]
AQEFREWADRERTIKDLQDKRLKLLEQVLRKMQKERTRARLCLAVEVLRKMQKERTRADAPITKRDVIAEYADFTSEDLSTFPGLVQLEASLHPSVLRAPEKHPKDMDKKKKSSHQVRKELEMTNALKTAMESIKK